MNQKFERIEKHLYLRQYQTAGGEWSTLYYARFKDWKGRQRAFPLGSELKTAREELTVYEARNIRREDFDLDKKKPDLPEPERLTVGRYLPKFLETKKALPSYGFWKSCGTHLERLLGPIALDEITRSKIVEYKQLRLGEPINRQGNPVEGSHVRPSTVNREITSLIGLLNLAAEDGLLEKIPATKRLKESEDHLARERVLEADEYKALIDASPRWLQRIIVGAYEACLSRVDLLTLTTDEIHRKRAAAALIKITGGRNKTKARQKVPISPALADVLDELDRERKKLTSLHGAGAVFTRDGKPISKDGLRKAFDAAKKQAKIKDFHFHDLRHCAVTRWTLAGIPEELCRLAAGHSRRSVHQRYVNPPDEHMVAIFTERLGWNCNDVVTQELRPAAESAN
jgi:integrase